ncbi:MAG: SpoIID/LytB domain-containing protein [Geobacteraceae bacterium]|nr:SpoIID/LytB domain-containing protein [Geobacteraceae bacterium]
MVHSVVFFLAVCVGAVTFASGSEAASAGTETIRVAVARGMEQIRVGGYGVVATDGRGARIAVSFPAVVKREKSGISIGGAPARSIRLHSPGVLQINGKGYRGTIEVAPTTRGLLVIDEILLEEYLIGLINCEISSQWPLEAVKAQAVVARTFALYQKEARKNSLYHLESTVSDQVYEGCDIEDGRAVRAVEETRGEVLTYGGKIIQAFFHSSCGGHTEDAENVWSIRYPYLRGVACTYCASSPSIIWEQTISKRKLETMLRSGGVPVFKLRSIRPVSRNTSGRITSLEILSEAGVSTIPAIQFRKIAGYGVIRSTDFEVSTVDDDFVFIGVGFGHGVGLCQWGAKQRAEDGFSYRDILSYYYPGTRLEKYYAD